MARLVRLWFFAAFGFLVAFLVLDTGTANADAGDRGLLEPVVQAADEATARAVPANDPVGEHEPEADGEPGDRREAGANAAPSTVVGTVEPVVDEVSGATRSIAQSVEPATEAVERLVDPAVDAAAPTVDAAAQVVEPALDRALDAAAPVTDSVLDAAAPITDPVLDAAAPITDPVLDAAAPVTDPVLGAMAGADPILGSNETAVDPAIGHTQPLGEPHGSVVSDAAPVVEPPVESNEPVGVPAVTDKAVHMHTEPTAPVTATGTGPVRAQLAQWDIRTTETFELRAWTGADTNSIPIPFGPSTDDARTVDGTATSPTPSPGASVDAFAPHPARTHRDGLSSILVDRERSLASVTFAPLSSPG